MVNTAWGRSKAIGLGPMSEEWDWIESLERSAGHQHLRASKVLGQKLRSCSQRLAAFGNKAMEQLPHMWHCRPQGQLHGNAGRASALGQPRRIIKQCLVRARVDQERG